MRIITEKDRTGLLTAFRTFVRAMNGERIASAAGADMISRALGAGVSVDALLNPSNWKRAELRSGDLSASAYADLLADHALDVRDLKDEDGWHLIENGFAIVAEAAHDFYLKLTGKGGKWNTPNALKNFGKAISMHSLQAILSEDLIFAVTSMEEPTTYFDYILAIAKDFNTLPVDDSMTEAQARWEELARETLEGVAAQAPAPSTEPLPEAPAEAEGEPAATETEEGGGAADTETDEGAGDGGYAEEEEPEAGAEATPFPDPEDYIPEPDPAGLGGFAILHTDIYSKYNPRDMKFDAVQKALQGYTPSEIGLLAKTIEGGEARTLTEIIIALTDGQFDPDLEDSATAQIHQLVTGDLIPAFIECVRTQGIEMDDEVAKKYDILHDSWDLRTPEVRRIHKLKRLVYTYASDNAEDLADLTAVIRDVEKLYEKED